MEGWSLAAHDAARRLARLEKELGEERLNGPDGALIRGAHWRNFLVKYTESNRMHKKMHGALRAVPRRRRSPRGPSRHRARPVQRRLLARRLRRTLPPPSARRRSGASCALAEALLRVNEAPGSGRSWTSTPMAPRELWMHGATFSAIISPARGGVIEEYTVFAHGINYANTLTRRREVYHQITPAERSGPRCTPTAGAPSIHDMEDTMRAEPAAAAGREGPGSDPRARPRR